MSRINTELAEHQRFNSWWSTAAFKALLMKPAHKHIVTGNDQTAPCLHPHCERIAGCTEVRGRRRRTRGSWENSGSALMSFTSLTLVVWLNASITLSESTAAGLGGVQWRRLVFPQRSPNPPLMNVRKFDHAAVSESIKVLMAGWCEEVQSGEIGLFQVRAVVCTQYAACATLD